jgi:hypothetical protein
VELLASSVVEVSVSLMIVEEVRVRSDAVLQELLASSDVETKPVSVVTVLMSCPPSSLEEEDQD